MSSTFGLGGAAIEQADDRFKQQHRQHADGDRGQPPDQPHRPGGALQKPPEDSEIALRVQL